MLPGGVSGIGCALVGSGVGLLDKAIVVSTLVNERSNKLLFSSEINSVNSTCRLFSRIDVLTNNECDDRSPITSNSCPSLLSSSYDCNESSEKVKDPAESSRDEEDDDDEAL